MSKLNYLIRENEKTTVFFNLRKFINAHNF